MSSCVRTWALTIDLAVAQEAIPSMRLEVERMRRDFTRELMEKCRAKRASGVRCLAWGFPFLLDLLFSGSIDLEMCT